MAEKTDKKQAVLDTMLDLVVERGLYDAPMSALSKLSGASTGVIYHYFPAKDDIIRALYQRTSAEKRDAVFEGISIGMDPKQAFMRIWRNTYRFYRGNPKKALFLDQYINSPFHTAHGPRDKSGDPMAAWMMKLGRPRSEGGILNDLPPEAVEALSFGSATALARAEKEFDEAALSRVAEAVWRAIAEVDSAS